MPNHDARFDIHMQASLGDESKTDQQAAERSGDGPFRIAIVGDYAARRHRGGTGGPLKPRRIDRDDVDSVLAAIAPHLRLVLGPDIAPIDITFAEMEDFHPDRLAERLPVFQSLLEMRREAASGTGPRRAPSVPRPNSTSASAAAMTEGSLLDMIVDASPGQSSAPASSSRPTDELSDFVRQAVRPHAVQERSAADADVVAKIDAVLRATMRAVLHHPDFQALESLWRATDFFVRRLDTDEDLQVHVVDGSAQDAATLTGAWSLIVANETIGPGDIDLAARLAAAGHRLGAPIMIGASPEFAGTDSFATGADPDDWRAELPREWDALRASPHAAYLGVVLPRLFLRLPYGKQGESCSAFPFEEIEAGNGAAHESYLWGNGAVACALIIASGVQTDGVPATQGTIEQLPLHVATVDGEARSVPCAEAALTTRAVTELLDRGLTPLVSMRDGDVVRAPRVQSIARPPRPLAIQPARSN